ncbi:PTS transporter subunit EIIC [Enterococcus casseliflavus]|uniref:PTS transporter subunit EIIC n=1 Tax=Enterococcus casseliflavus TaxID=37734 RepID=UPI0035E38C18
MSKDYDKLAKNIVELVGGESNIESLTHCVTRLRFVLKDESIANTKELSKLKDVIQVQSTSGQYQVVIGMDVDDVYNAILKTSDVKVDKASGKEMIEREEKTKKSGLLDKVIDTISGIFMPFIGAFMATGLLKGILIILTTVGWLSDQSSTYTILYSISDGLFYFLPIFLAYTSAKKFNAEPFVGMAVAAALVYPNISAIFNSGDTINLFGIPVTMINYTSSVIPIIVAVYFQSVIEKFLKRIIPQLIRGILLPLLSLFIVSILTFVIIGPVSNLLSTAIAGGITFLLDLSPLIAGGVLGLLYPLMLIFGFHWGLIPIAMNNFSTMGGDPLFAITFTTNFAIAGCALGVFLKTKNLELKEQSGTSAISAFVAGVTEPAIYGVLLKYKKPFIIVCLLDAIGGAILGASGAIQTAMITANVLTLPAFVAMLGSPAIISAVIGLVGGVVLTYLFGFNDKMLD